VSKPLYAVITSVASFAFFLAATAGYPAE